MRTGRLVPGCTLALAIVLSAPVVAPRASSRQMTVSIADALTYYALGERDAVLAALAGAGGGDSDELIALFDRDVTRWVNADGPAHAAARRYVAATFALEAGYAALDAQWAIATRVVEWACEMLRASGPPSERERRWHLAALALLEGSFEAGGPTQPPGEILQRHLAHIRLRFPNEPRIALARALIKEYEYWTLHDRPSPTPGIRVHDESAAGLAIPSLEAAVTQRDNRPEALLRLGFLEYRRGRVDVALEYLDEAARGDDDPSRVYLAHLFTGWAHEQEGRMGEATVSYRRALAAVHGLSAALSLGVRLYVVNERDEADSVVQTALEQALPDPWKLYGYGDLRRWPAIIAELRRQNEPQ